MRATKHQATIPIRMGARRHTTTGKHHPKNIERAPLDPPGQTGVRTMSRVIPKVTVAGHRDRGPELQNTWWSPRGEPPAPHAAHINFSWYNHVGSVGGKEKKLHTT